MIIPKEGVMWAPMHLSVRRVFGFPILLRVLCFLSFPRTKMLDGGCYDVRLTYKWISQFICTLSGAA